MNKEKTAEEVLNVLKMQEEILQFTHFTNQDAWELGKLMVDEARKRELAVGILIRRANGLTVFSHMMDGTTIDNREWLERKFNTVLRTEVSTLEFYMYLQNSGNTMETKFMDEMKYACVGGGFPVKVEDAGLVGAVCVSGLNHVADHDFIIKCLSRYLHMDEVPRLKKI
ncbi:MAG: heme-degrading domain-containing protein [Lachnospiraceae bacterium]|nr:heme-degrading domain-containing protein [Lachnospiraceae bacterium]